VGEQGKLRIFAGSSNPRLAAGICQYLGTEPGELEVTRFADNEILVRFMENIRGCDVFIVQTTTAPAENLLELLIMIDAAVRASARRVTVVTPYFGYARQDRKDQPRVAITAKLSANLIATAGANRMLTMDLHSPQIQGFFDIPFDHLYAAPILIGYFRERDLSRMTIVAPDLGSVKMNRAYANRLGVPIAVIDKRRARKDTTEVMNLIGEVEGRDVLLLDDEISTAGTMAQAAVALRERGARRIHAGATHGKFVGEALKRIGECPIEEVVVTDSISQHGRDLGPKVKTLSVAPLLGEAIKRIHEERSLSSLFV
jgi:ribose-phosphate pyrophosphokinase